MRISQKLDLFCWPDSIFFLTLFLSFFSPLLFLLAFALHILSDSRKTFRIDYLENLEHAKKEFGQYPVILTPHLVNNLSIQATSTQLSLSACSLT